MMPRFYVSSCSSRNSAPSLDGIFRDSRDRDGDRLLPICCRSGSGQRLPSLHHFLPCPVGSRLGCTDVLFGILIAATMLWSLIPRREAFTAPGLLLERSRHPSLFAEIENITAALNEPVPHDVYLIGDANAFVADRGGVMGFGSRRIMGLGLPLLSTMTVSQFRAVLAHEFAHYYGGDTSLGPWVYRTKTSIVRIFENIGSVGQLARIAVLAVMYMAVTTLLKWYFVSFLRISNFVSRKQEYRADELACIVAGRQNLIDGLQALHRAAAVWPTCGSRKCSPF